MQIWCGCAKCRRSWRLHHRTNNSKLFEVAACKADAVVLNAGEADDCIIEQIQNYYRSLHANLMQLCWVPAKLTTTSSNKSFQIIRSRCMQIWCGCAKCRRSWRLHHRTNNSKLLEVAACKSDAVVLNAGEADDYIIEQIIQNYSRSLHANLMWLC